MQHEERAAPGRLFDDRTYAMDPSGYWLNETSVTKPTSWVASRGSPSDDKITYDGDTHRWVDVTYGDGGTYGLAFSKGWSGSSMVWHDVSFAPSADIASQTDSTTTKVSATKITYVVRLYRRRRPGAK